MGRLTHTDEKGAARMVDVSGKAVTRREAWASGRVAMSQKGIDAIREARTPKGDPLETARIAGIMAAKRTAELIPLCHPLMLEHIDVRCTLTEDGVSLSAAVVTNQKTGAEMEALTAVSVAALTVYDMCKAVDRAMSIGGIQLDFKDGGRSGPYSRK